MKRIICAIFVIFLFCSRLPLAAPLVGKVPQSTEDKFLPEGNEKIKVEVWVENLEIPWSLVFLPGGRALVSERPGRIRLIKDGKLQKIPYAELEVAHNGEGGLMGLAVPPEKSEKPYVYAVHTYRKNGSLRNRVVRFKDLGDKGVFDRVIIDEIPGGRAHDGGRIAFGPDLLLYITTGEIFKAELAQDLNSLAGKILRIGPEGNIPKDNPFKNSPIYSYGHRNPQGLSWHPETGDLLESEHGPSGEFSLVAYDEINMIMKGGNYGWPKVIGAPGIKSYVDPIIAWKKTTPPSGMTFYNASLLPSLQGDLFVATLRSEALIRIKLKWNGHAYRAFDIERWFAGNGGQGKFGRLRDVVQGPEGALYFLTSNRDGRGNPRKSDDRIYRIVPN